MQHIQVLQFLRRLYTNSLKSELADLTSRQMAILLTVYLEKDVRRVRHISDTLKLSKPAVSRGLNKLESLNLVKRRPDEGDGRSVVVHRTTHGSWFLTATSDIFFEANPNELPHHKDVDVDATLSDTFAHQDKIQDS